MATSNPPVAQAEGATDAAGAAASLPVGAAPELLTLEGDAALSSTAAEALTPSSEGTATADAVAPADSFPAEPSAQDAAEAPAPPAAVPPEAALAAEPAAASAAPAAAAADQAADTSAAASEPGTPVKAAPPALTVPMETPAAVRTMTGVGEGFQDDTKTPFAAPKPSVADVVAASLADAAPSPTNEPEFSAFHEAVGEELKMAKAASDAAEALGTPDAADDILKQMTSPAPSLPLAEQKAEEQAGAAAADGVAGAGDAAADANAVAADAIKAAASEPEGATAVALAVTAAPAAATAAEAEGSVSVEVAPPVPEGSGAAPERAALADSPTKAVPPEVARPSSGSGLPTELPTVPEQPAMADDPASAASEGPEQPAVAAEAAPAEAPSAAAAEPSDGEVAPAAKPPAAQPTEEADNAGSSDSSAQPEAAKVEATPATAAEPAAAAEEPAAAAEAPAPEPKEAAAAEEPAAAPAASAAAAAEEPAAAAEPAVAPAAAAEPAATKEEAAEPAKQAGSPVQSPAVASTPAKAPQTSAFADAAPATPTSIANGGTSEAPATPELTRTPSSVQSCIAALKTSPTPADQPSTPPSDLPSPNSGGETTPNSVKARIAAMRRTSETFAVDNPSIPRLSPSASPSRRWSVNAASSSPAGPPASGEVVEEAAQPKTQLKSFWEAQRPVGVTKSPGSPMRRSSGADGFNEGRKWQVKLNMPLASGKVSDLSYFKKQRESSVDAPPPPEFKHKIGDATFPLDQLKGMNGDDGIDPANKELYLADEEFLSAFETDKEAYKAKPKWRQVLLKKKAGLF